MSGHVLPPPSAAPSRWWRSDKGATLADLYDPLAMPPALVKAHRALDRAVDLAYRPQPFTTETEPGSLPV